MEQVHDVVRALLTQLGSLALDQLGQGCAGLEVDILHLVFGDGAVAIADSADDADLDITLVHQHGAVAVADPLVGGAVIHIDAQDGELCQLVILFDGSFAPVELVVAQRHGAKAHMVHPVGDDQTLCQIGLGSALPHIAGREEQRVLIVFLGLFQEGGQLVHAGVVVAVGKLAVEVIDVVEINDHQYGNTAAVALAVIALVHMLAVGHSRLFLLLGLRSLRGAGSFCGTGGFRGLGALGGTGSLVCGLGSCLGGGIRTVGGGNGGLRSNSGETGLRDALLRRGGRSAGAEQQAKRQ